MAFEAEAVSALDQQGGVLRTMRGMAANAIALLIGCMDMLAQGLLVAGPAD
jgi:hypothetical protein